jgi:hypothetical protein
MEAECGELAEFSDDDAVFSPVSPNHGASSRRSNFQFRLAAIFVCAGCISTAVWFSRGNLRAGSKTDPSGIVQRNELTQKDGNPASWAPPMANGGPHEGLKPTEDLNDGNTCEDGEELFERVCYKACAELTNGAATLRTTAWSCCKKQGTGLSAAASCLMHSKVSTPVPCGGFDVSAAGTCPKSPGACLTDEETFLGKCYKRCSSLTLGEYPYRAGMSTCSKSTSVTARLNPLNDKTSPSFNVGGGGGDGDPSTPKTAHAPITALTER